MDFVFQIFFLPRERRGGGGGSAIRRWKGRKGRGWREASLDSPHSLVRLKLPWRGEDGTYRTHVWFSNESEEGECFVMACNYSTWLPTTRCLHCWANFFIIFLIAILAFVLFLFCLDFNARSLSLPSLCGPTDRRRNKIPVLAVGCGTRQLFASCDATSTTKSNARFYFLISCQTKKAIRINGK